MQAASVTRQFDPSTGRASRTLVLCFDGTNEEFEDTNSNVVKLFALLERTKPGEQLLYYQTGIGTYTDPAILGPVSKWVAKTVDKAIAWYLDAHIKQGYTWLMNTYCPGDKIALFGYSRGAYIARGLAGMLKRVGLLTYGAVEQVDFAYKMYKRTDKKSARLAEAFKATFSQPVTVEFIGCWDTVASVGVVMPRTLPFVTDNETVKTFRQALSIDERRVMFAELLWNNGYPPSVPPPDGNDGVGRVLSGPAAPGIPSLLPARETKQDDVDHNKREVQHAGTTVAGPAWPYKQKTYETDVQECWFAGFHADVGGGDLPNSTRIGLDGVPLAWMVRQVAAADCGIIFNEDALTAAGIIRSDHDGPAPRGSLDTSREEFEKDATAKAHDSLATFGVKTLWWALEIIPLPRSYYILDKQGKQVQKTKWLPNFGRGRHLPPGAKVHESFRFRVENIKGYKPKGKIPNDATYVY